MGYTKQTWVNGTAGNTPVNADRLNHMEDGIEDAYYDDTYSTTETLTDKIWTDGKPIYRIVATLTNYGTIQNQTNIAFAINNIDTVTFQYYQYAYEGEQRTFPLVETTGNVLDLCYKSTTQQLHFSGTGSWSARPLTVTIEYTKSS